MPAAITFSQQKATHAGSNRTGHIAGNATANWFVDFGAKPAGGHSLAKLFTRLTDNEDPESTSWSGR
jgi:hypothetical protein